LEQQPTFSGNTGPTMFQQNRVFSAQQKAQSSRSNNLSSSYFQRGPNKNIKLDGSFNGGPNENSLNVSSSISNQRTSKLGRNGGMINRDIETKYISLDPFDDRKNSTRTDVDI
jgi:hypothetical protein